MHYLWDGNRQLQEQTDTHIFTTIYEQDSFEPVARLVWLQDGIEIAANELEYRSVWDDKPKPQSDIQIYHCHNDHLGTPNELTTHEGEVVWLADYEAWGNTAKVLWRDEKLGQIQVSAEELQPIRFQGQSFDTETGLHYNRFRYFDPDLGMFTTRDPIGLLGGNNVFQYAPNPTGWIDPWGLKKKCLTYNHTRKPNKKTNISELRRQIRGQIAAMNRIIKEEGMVGLKNRIRNYNPSIRKEGDEFIRELGSAGKGKAWLHEPDMRVGGLPTDVTRSGDSRINSIIGGQANRLAEDILKMPDDTTGLTYKLKTK